MKMKTNSICKTPGDKLQRWWLTVPGRWAALAEFKLHQWLLLSKTADRSKLWKLWSRDDLSCWNDSA